MSTEVTFEDEAPPAEVPPTVVTPPTKEANGHDKPKKEAKASKADSDKEPPKDGDDVGPAKVKLTKPLKELQISEHAALRDYLTSLGVQEADVKIQVYRQSPETAIDQRTGRMVQVSGLIKSYFNFIDEEFIQQAHGGGKFQIRVNTRDPSGKWIFFRSRTFEIVGDPRTDDVPRNIPDKPAAPAPAAAPTEAPSATMKAMDVLERQLERANQRDPAPAAAPDMSAAIEAFKMMSDSLKQQLASRDAELAAVRREMADMRNMPPPKDELKDKMLNSMIDGESGRITALREQYGSEIRQIKEGHAQDLKRIQDQFERDKMYLVQSHEREIATIRSSNEVAVQALKTSHETSIKILEAQLRSIDKENTELRSDNKELRAKKEKSTIELVKEMKEIKEAFEVEGTEQTAVDKILDVVTNPDAISAAREIIRGPAPAAAQQQAAQQQAAVAQQQARQPQRQIVKVDGQTFVREPNGELRKVKKKIAPGEVELPDIPQTTIALAVTYLEAAFSRAQDPKEVANSVKLQVPSEIIAALRDHGPDVFMRKIAKIKDTSPLASQDARNWVRNVCKELVGG